MVNDEPLALLKDARSRKLPWADVADALLDAETRSLTAVEGRPWIQIASDLSTYSTNQLRRMTRVIQFVRQLVRDEKIADEAIVQTMPFSHLETAMRIYTFEPETGLKLFRGDWVRPTYPSLLAVYQRLRETAPKTYAPMVAGKRAARQLQDTTLSILASAKFLPISANTPLRRLSNPSRYANPDFWLLQPEARAPMSILAVDCYPLIGPSQRDSVMRRALHVATECTFFDEFWAVIPDPDNAGIFMAEVDALRLSNVGVIVIELNRRKVLYHRSPSSPPSPDRRDLLKSSLIIR